MKALSINPELARMLTLARSFNEPGDPEDEREQSYRNGYIAGQAELICDVFSLGMDNKSALCAYLAHETDEIRILIGFEMVASQESLDRIATNQHASIPFDTKEVFDA